MPASSKHFLVLPAFVLLLLAAASIRPALAAPGDIDTSFNEGVPVVEDDNTEGVGLGAEAAAISPLTGDILWAGTGGNPGGQGIIYAYKPDGSLDTAVGGSGEIGLTSDQAGLSGGVVQLFAIAVDSQGRILVTGLASNSSTIEMVLARFKSDGTLDTSFGAAGTGIVTNALNTLAAGTGLSLTADGHILVTGSAADPSVSQGLLTIWRFDADGMPDSAYGDSGHVQIAAIASSFFPVFCFSALQPDGALIAGYSLTGAGGSTGPWKLTRLKSDGSVDTSFGTSGFVTGATNQEIAGLALAPDGGFVFSELDTSGGSPYPLDLRHYKADGSVDPGFNGGNPLAFGNVPEVEAKVPVAVQPDGKILSSGNGGGNTLGIGRLNADGTLDTGFGPSGVASIGFSGIGGNNYTPYPTALLVQGNGKIVVSGFAGSSAGSHDAAFVTRVLNDTFSFTPDAISFMDQTDVDTGVTVTSNAVTISGLTDGVSVPVSVSGGEYKINSGAWTSQPGMAQNGDQIAVRHTSSSANSTSTTTTLTVGGEAIPNNNETVLGTPATADFTSTTKAAPTPPPPSGGGGGCLGLLVLLALLSVCAVSARRRRDT